MRERTATYDATRQVVRMPQPHRLRLLTFATAEAAVSVTAETAPSDSADVTKCAEYDQHLAGWSVGEKYIHVCIYTVSQNGSFKSAPASLLARRFR